MLNLACRDMQPYQHPELRTLTGKMGRYKPLIVDAESAGDSVAARDAAMETAVAAADAMGAAAASAGDAAEHEVYGSMAMQGHVSLAAALRPLVPDAGVALPDGYSSSGSSSSSSDDTEDAMPVQSGSESD
jgi:hypothetical protein